MRRSGSGVESHSLATRDENRRKEGVCMLIKVMMLKNAKYVFVDIVRDQTQCPTVPCFHVVVRLCGFK